MLSVSTKGLIWNYIWGKILKHPIFFTDRFSTDALFGDAASIKFKEIDHFYKLMNKRSDPYFGIGLNFYMFKRIFKRNLKGYDGIPGPHGFPGKDGLPGVPGIKGEAGSDGKCQIFLSGNQNEPLPQITKLQETLESVLKRIENCLL
uniref:Candidate secreted effector n=1 Tax=Meloidogyne incognita TaxID=6306 RepID=A0A914MI88_MELIC